MRARGSGYTSYYLIENRLEFLLNRGISQFVDHDVSFGNSNYIHIGPYVMLVQTKKFSQQALHPIPLDGLADLLAHSYSKPDSPSITLPLTDKKKETRRVKPPAFLIAGHVLTALGQAQGARIRGRWDPRYCIPIFSARAVVHNNLGQQLQSDLYRQPFTSFGPSSTKYRPSTFGSGTNEKTMGPFSAYLAGLKCTFHIYLLLNWILNTCEKQPTDQHV
jgi:hypothetical protein